MAPRDISGSAGCGCGGSCGGNCGSCTGNCSCAKSAVMSLKLEFSKAADYGRVDKVFNPAVKKAFDPQDFVLKRAEPAFRDAVENGRAVFLSDNHNNVKSLVMAYHYQEAGAEQAQTPHPYTEIGTTLAMLPGYRSAYLMISVIALKEWLNNPPAKTAAAEIEDSNGYSLRAYRDTLKWDRLDDQALVRDLYDAHDPSMADPKDRGKGHLPAGKTHHHWYEYSDQHVAIMAQILLSYMNQGGLFNKHSQSQVAVDFSALDGVGLTRPRLEAMAQGETSRTRLQRINGPGPA